MCAIPFTLLRRVDISPPLSPDKRRAVDQLRNTSVVRTDLLPHIAQAEGRIHFAGDHTSSTPGWMEGALQSAERVVQEIAAAVRGASSLVA